MKPVLVIQMQRMGDLILSFPLLLWLMRRFPGHPIWVMGEPQFFGPLARLSPNVRYFGFQQAHEIRREQFRLVINLSHRPESMELAGQLDCEHLIGGYTRDGVTRIAGDWQEYRASLVHNNRHNRFHWADLNALDVIPHAEMVSTNWPEPRLMPANINRVGLFLGASEAGKRPEASFWAELIPCLERFGMAPILLGGPAEVELGREVQRLARRPVVNACGTLRLDQFAMLGQTLSLMITPDTGPMHLSAWTGLKTLNLSMGPVHAWETGPYQPGHLVMRAGHSCVGCWQCRFDSIHCHRPFVPERVARVAEEFRTGRQDHLRGLRLPGLQLLFSGRSKGLYVLTPLTARTSNAARVSAYWQAFWWHAFGLGSEDACIQASRAIFAASEALGGRMLAQSHVFLHKFSRVRQSKDITLLKHFLAAAPCLQPLGSYAEIHLANHDLAAESFKRTFELVERHLQYLRSS